MASYWCWFWRLISHTSNLLFRKYGEIVFKCLLHVKWETEYDQNNGPFMLWLYTFKLTWILTFTGTFTLTLLYCSSIWVNHYVFLKLYILFLSKSFDKFFVMRKVVSEWQTRPHTSRKRNKLALFKMKWGLYLAWTVYMLGDLCQHLVSYIRVFCWQGCCAWSWQPRQGVRLSLTIWSALVLFFLR